MKTLKEQEEQIEKNETWFKAAYAVQKLAAQEQMSIEVTLDYLKTMIEILEKKK